MAYPPLAPHPPEMPPQAAGATLEGTGRWSALLARLDSLAVEASHRPLGLLTRLIALNLVLLPVFVGAGLLLGDQALMLREGAPGTFLSFAWLVAIAVAARAVYLRDGAPFWKLSALVFTIFAVDEITQAGLFLSKWVSSAFDVAPAGGFNDLDSVFLTLLFLGCGALLALKARVLLRHPLTLALLAAGAVIGAASQGLDSFVTPTKWEFVAEESLKLTAEPFFIAAYLAALAAVLRRSERPEG